MPARSVNCACPRLDAQVAWELGSRIRPWAAERGLVLVYRRTAFGQPLFYARSRHHARQRRVGAPQEQRGARFHRSSYAVGMKLKAEGTTLLERYGLAVADYAAVAARFR